MKTTTIFYKIFERLSELKKKPNKNSKCCEDTTTSRNSTQKSVRNREQTKKTK